MTAIDPETLDQEARRARRFTRINKADAWFQVVGLAWMTPILKAAAESKSPETRDRWWKTRTERLLKEINSTKAGRGDNE